MLGGLLLSSKVSGTSLSFHLSQRERERESLGLARSGNLECRSCHRVPSIPFVCYQPFGEALSEIAAL